MLDNQDPQKGEVVLYQPNETIRIEVRMENETVWLTQAQMAELFNKDQSVIARHIKNIFDEQEVYEESNMQILHNTLSKFKPTKVYSLDVIISVGYRVKSQRGTLFRQWATNVIKERLKRNWSNDTKRIENVENRLSAVESKIDFFVRTSLPPVEGVFSNGQIFDAYTFACDLIRSAKKSLILIDNYVDDTVLEMFSKRQSRVDVTIYTAKITPTLHLDVARHNAQYPQLTLQTCRNFHDRFLLVDDKVYHIGASLKDLGKKLFAFSLLEDFRVEEIVTKVHP